MFFIRMNQNPVTCDINFSLALKITKNLERVKRIKENKQVNLLAHSAMKSSADKSFLLIEYSSLDLGMTKLIIPTNFFAGL